jgi:hypothetical protein
VHGSLYCRGEAASIRPAGTAVVVRAAWHDRTQKLLIVVVLVFSLSWLPINAINLVKDLGYDIASG